MTVLLGRASVISWVLQIFCAVILGQTLFFKFSAAPEPVYIFSILGVEPWGRLATACMELASVILLLYPKTPVYGAGLALAAMLGALAAHLGKLGIEVLGDHGLLFGMACAVLLASLGILWLRRSQIPFLGLS
jgi:hypothetical protein